MSDEKSVFRSKFPVWLTYPDNRVELSPCLGNYSKADISCAHQKRNFQRSELAAVQFYTSSSTRIAFKSLTDLLTSIFRRNLATHFSEIF